MQGTIGISGLKFRAFHGVFEEEQLHGNDFVVDCSAEVLFPLTGDKIEDVVDYANMYRLIEARMHERYDLLETLVRFICLDILREDDRVRSVWVRVGKSQSQRWGAGAQSYAELRLDRSVL